MSEPVYHTSLAFAVFVYFAMVAFFVRSGQASMRHPATFFLAFHGFVFVFRPLVALYYDFKLVYWLYLFQPSLEDKINAILASTLAMVVFTFVTVLACSRKNHDVLPVEFTALRERFGVPLLVAAGIITPVALWSTLSNWGLRADEFGQMERDAATGALVNTTQSGWFTDLGMMLAPLAVLVLWRARYRWWGWIFFGAFVLAQAGTGTRSPILFAVAAVLLLYLLERGLRWPRWQIIVPVLGAILIFNLIVVDRGRAVRDAFVDDDSVQYAVAQDLAPLESMDFANLEYLEYITYAVPQRTGTYDYFANNLQIFTEPIPRALWPDKPIGPPIQNFSLFDYGRPIGMTASVAGQGWMALGYPGVVIHTAAIALFYALLFRSLSLSGASPLRQIFYVLMLAATTLTLRDGGFLTIFRVLPFYLGPLFLTVFLARLLRGPAGQSNERGLTKNALARTPAERRKHLSRQDRKSVSESSNISPQKRARLDRARGSVST